MPNKKQFKTHEDYLEWYRKYRRENKERMHEISKRYRDKSGYSWNKDHPEEAAAQQILNCSIRKGKIKRGNCVVCNKPNAYGHHEDYTKPLKVIWLCNLHHRQLHSGKYTIKEIYKIKGRKSKN